MPSLPPLDQLLQGPAALYGVLLVLVLLLLVVRRFSDDPAMRRRAMLVSGLLFLFVALRIWLRFIPPLVPRLVEGAGGEPARMVEVTNPLAHSIVVTSLIVALLAALLLVALLLVDVLLVRRLKVEVPKILPDIAVLAAFFFGVILILYYRTTLDITGLFTTSALFTVVIGLALQDTLGNLFSGLALQTERSFRVGDWVRFGTYEGLITDVSWRATKIRTRDNDLIVVPNTVMGKDALMNFSVPTPVHGVVSEVGCHYRHPPASVMEALEEAAHQAEGVLSRPTPSVRTKAFGDFAITYEIRYWIRDYAAEPEIRSDLMTRIWYVFDRRGIEIPFPIRNVFMQEMAGRPTDGRRHDADDRVRDRLARCDLFSFLSPDELHRLAPRVRTERYFTGETVIQQGDTGDSLYVIDEGRVEVLVRSANKEPEQVAELGVPSFFGEMSMMVDEPRSATVRTLAPTRFFVIDREAFRDILLANPAIGDRLSETLVQRKRELDAALATPAEEPPEVEERRILDRIRDLFGF